eukprot:13072298-Ditylum_brightwellii.AAC.1
MTEQFDSRNNNGPSQFTAQRRNRRRTMSKIITQKLTPPPALQNGQTVHLSSSSEEEWDHKPKPALEWDVFLYPNFVQCVDTALGEKESRGVYVDQEERMAASVEVDRQVGCLMNRMMLCHGSTS